MYCKTCFGGHEGLAMRYRITITSALPSGSTEQRLPDLVASGPFRVWDLRHIGGGAWTFTLQPVRPGLAVGFGNVAELLVRLAREFEVIAVDRAAVEALAAAS